MAKKELTVKLKGRITNWPLAFLALIIPGRLGKKLAYKAITLDIVD